MGEKMDQINNYMEVLVDKYLNSVLEQWNICKCERCRRDIMTLALNHLKPMYTSTEAGKVYTKANITFNQQYATDVVLAINQAAGVVSKEVRHGK